MWCVYVYTCVWWRGCYPGALTRRILQSFSQLPIGVLLQSHSAGDQDEEHSQQHSEKNIPLQFSVKVGPGENTEKLKTESL